MTPNKVNVNGSTFSNQSERTRMDTIAVWLSIFYLLALLVFFSWQLFDTWVGQHSLPRVLGYQLTRLDTPAFRLVYYSVLGGALGGVLNGMRSSIQHFANFKAQYAWKYIVGPWMGAILGLIVYALVQGSFSVLGGNGNLVNVSTTQALSNFAAGALAGYGVRDVFVWLDAQVTKAFKVTPDVRGMQQEDAAAHIESAGGTVGEIARVKSPHGVADGIVIDQKPSPDTPMADDMKVDLLTGDNRNNA